jgi:toxin FitB
MILLDTNIVSEFMGAAPDPRVAEWLREQKLANLALASITIGEIGYGLALLPDGRRRASLTAAFERLRLEIIGSRVLSFDENAARAYGALMAQRQQAGLHVESNDMQIAALAHVHGHRVATRNLSDFEGLGLNLINPFVHGT